ncbi:MAG TPA: sigma-70 family RNA polymerase sigma factor [Polyangiaceae bacterium]|nr:sigma-70 family RNA polymerase sigma factor [Polyangiaceae bacterium]
MDNGKPTPAVRAAPISSMPPASGFAPRAPAAPSPSRSANIELARRAAAGDARATRSLLETVAPAVLRSVRQMLGSAHPDIDDASQLALIGFVQALGTFRGECDPVHFAIRIAIRTAGATRRRYRSRYDRRDEEVDIDTLEAAPDVPQATLRRQAILRLVDDLPEEQAETMAMRFVLGWKLHEIAQATGAPFNTVRSRLRLAKEALLRRIQRDPTLAEALDAEDP